MPPLRHSISQLFAPHPAFALRGSQVHEKSQYTAPSTTPINDEMISCLQPKRPTVPTPSTSSAPPSNPHPPISSISPPTPLSFSSPSVSPSPSFPALTFSALAPPRTQIEALPPHTTPTSTPITTTTTTTFAASSPFLYITHTNGKFILDSAKRHPVFFTDKLRRAPAGVETNGYGYEDWKAGSPVARGYVYESGAVEEREAKL
ncbi:c5b34f44-1ada-4806-b52a-c8a9fb9f4649 [Sclerotinia trifoliorum]|uniref:C5b34f44-1ada-4806-b52a-c8a9fb9f4649 n=1 Tax=Sclerotinia trifoliorum TaxID=28548 RepID=A0A8H2ZWG6_9HELO|nr:c5b34f44-1ada-4806-b52a-c8a9fb9f4649 [Sclerotinia trifoliorum]